MVLDFDLVQALPDRDAGPRGWQRSLDLAASPSSVSRSTGRAITARCVRSVNASGSAPGGFDVDGRAQRVYQVVLPTTVLIERQRRRDFAHRLAGEESRLKRASPAARGARSIAPPDIQHAPPNLAQRAPRDAPRATTAVTLLDGGASCLPRESRDRTCSRPGRQLAALIPIAARPIASFTWSQSRVPVQFEPGGPALRDRPEQRRPVRVPQLPTSWLPPTSAITVQQLLYDPRPWHRAVRSS